MDTVTYPHGGVQRRLNESFVACRLRIDESETLAKRFLVPWTPGLLFLDAEERVHYRAFGYHPPEDFEHLIHVGHGMMILNRGKYAEAVSIFAEAARDPSRTSLQPEAMYWLGVCEYKNGDKDGMKRTWNQLLDLYPQSLWAKKAGFIRPEGSVAA